MLCYKFQELFTETGRGCGWAMNSLLKLRISGLLERLWTTEGHQQGQGCIYIYKLYLDINLWCKAAESNPDIWSMAQKEVKEKIKSTFFTEEIYLLLDLIKHGALGSVCTLSTLCVTVISKFYMDSDAIWQFYILYRYMTCIPAIFFQVTGARF